jgi:hypothetical protein
MGRGAKTKRREPFHPAGRAVEVEVAPGRRSGGERRGNRGEYDANLPVGKIYRVVEPKRNDRTSDIRVVDESGGDYLYPRSWFVPVLLPLEARRILAAIP